MGNSSLKIMKPRGSITSDKTGGLNSPDLDRTLTVVGKVSENRLMLRLKEMERINSFLEKLIEQRTIRLREVIATNTKFLSILSHDLRSPFSSILCSLEIIKDNLNNLNKCEIVNYIDIASDSANNTLNLLDNLLTWTIAQNNGKSFNPVKINLRELLNDEIAVKDNGIGMSRAAQRNLFKNDGFYSKTGTNHEKGTGLGLLLCKEFIELHGGKIWVESEIGKGSDFKFTLPLSTE